MTSTSPCAHPWHSVSSSTEYLRCPRRYSFSHVERRPQDRPVPPGWRFGSVVHAGLEAAYRLQVDHPELPRRRRVEAAHEAIEASWAGLDLADDGGMARAKWIVGRSLTRDVLQVERIRGVEVGLRASIDDTEQIVGFADLVLDRGDGTIEIVDHKVTRRPATPEQLQSNLQLNLYGRLASLMWAGIATVRASHHYPLLDRVVAVTLDDATMQAAQAQIEQIADQIRADQVFAAQPGEHCSHCPWQPSCPEAVAAGIAP
jgi:putative RecB family exonuclease